MKSLIFLECEPWGKEFGVIDTWEILHILLFHGRVTGNLPVMSPRYERFCTGYYHFFTAGSPLWWPSNLTYTPATLLKLLLWSLKRPWYQVQVSLFFFFTLVFLRFSGVVYLTNDSAPPSSQEFILYLHILSKKLSWLKILIEHDYHEPK